jgi:hypothetical protein
VADVLEHRRRSVRLRGWDYPSAGAYFITIVTHDRHSLFGAIIADRVELSPYGEAVQGEWLLSADIRKEMELDEFIVMPNHLHGIVWIMGSDRPGHDRGGAQRCASTHGGRSRDARRGARPCAPTTASKIVGRLHGRLQNGLHQTHQRHTAHSWPPRLATQLLRPRHTR